MRKSCGICKYLVLQLSQNSYCAVHIDAEIDVDNMQEWCKDFRLPYSEPEPVLESIDRDSTG